MHDDSKSWCNGNMHVFFVWLCSNAQWRWAVAPSVSSEPHTLFIRVQERKYGKLLLQLSNAARGIGVCVRHNRHSKMAIFLVLFVAMAWPAPACGAGDRSTLDRSATLYDDIVYTAVVTMRLCCTVMAYQIACTDILDLA